MTLKNLIYKLSIINEKDDDITQRWVPKPKLEVALSNGGECDYRS